MSEIRAIATARAQFNEDWVRYVNEGRFNQDATEIDSKEERAKLYIETFSNKSEKKLLAILLPGMCALFIEDAKQYNNVINLIDNHRNSDSLSDCLYAYLHLLYCCAPNERYEMDKEVKEKLWFSSMRKKLTPYVKSSTGFIEQLFHNQGGRWVLNVAKLVVQEGSLRRNLRRVQLSLFDKVQANKQNQHSKECFASFCAAIQQEVINTVQKNPYATFIEAYNEFFKKFNDQTFRLLLSNTDVFECWFDKNFIPVLKKMEAACIDGEKWRKIIEGADPVINSYQTTCCAEWQKYQDSLKKEKKQTRKQNVKLQTKGKGAACAKPSSVTQNEDASAVPLSVTKIEEQEVLNSPAAQATSKDSAEDDILSFEIYSSPSNEEEEDAPNPELGSVEQQEQPSFLQYASASISNEEEEDAAYPELGLVEQVEQPSFLQYTSALMILETKGPVDYDKFMKQLKKDFKGNIWRRSDEKKNSRLVKVIFPVSTDINLCACAMYDLPHGSQLLKTWPQWRDSFKNMFLSLEKDLHASTPMKLKK